MQWTFRKKDYKSISKTKLTKSIAQNSTQIGLGLIGLGPIGLILGRILGQSADITTLSKSLRKKNKNLLKEISYKEMKEMAFRYKKFPIYSLPGQLLNVAGSQLPILFLSFIYGSSVVGFFD